MNITAIDPSDGKWRKYLSEKRLEKINRLRTSEKKAQSIGAELLLRHAVKDLTGNGGNVLWSTDDNGKLFLTEYPEIYVNLSHSANYAVCAAHSAPVGIDIQYTRGFDERLIKRYFTPDEGKYIHAANDAKNAFYHVWTRKESLLKACGKGLAVPLNEICVLADEIIYGGTLYRFREYSIADKDYKISVSFASSPE